MQQSFPVVGWLSTFTKIRSDDGPDNVYADCPFCKGKNTLAASKLKLIFRCFKCYEGGYARDIWNGTCDLTKMIMLLEKCNYSQAILRKKAITGIYVPVKQVRPILERTTIWPGNAIPLKECSPNNDAKKMLRRRSVEHLVNVSYYCTSGKFADRALLPCSWFGEISGFEAKSTNSIMLPKALYPVWFRASEHLYSTQNWDWSKSFAVITESIIDAETLGCNAIGLYGSTLKNAQLNLLLDLKKNGLFSIVLMLDADAFKKAAKIILKQVLGLFDCFIVPLNGNEDPNFLGRDECWRRVAAATKISSIDELLPFYVKYGVF